MITLRAIEESDLGLIQLWRNSTYVMPYCRQYRPLSYQDMVNWYETKKDDDYNLTTDLFMIMSDMTPIGVGGYTRIDWRNRKGEVSFYVGKVDSLDEKTIIEALSVVVAYGLRTLNLFKVYFPCYSNNPYLEYYEKVMEREYTAPKEYYWNGVYLDRIILSKYEDCKCETMTL